MLTSKNRTCNSYSKLIKNRKYNVTCLITIFGLTQIYLTVSLPFDKRPRTRSRLYRSRFVQPNTHFLAFCEIYKIHTPSHRSKFKIFAKIRQTIFALLLEFLQKIFFGQFSSNFARILMICFFGISPNILENAEKS